MDEARKEGVLSEGQELAFTGGFEGEQRPGATAVDEREAKALGGGKEPTVRLPAPPGGLPAILGETLEGPPMPALNRLRSWLSQGRGRPRRNVSRRPKAEGAEHPTEERLDYELREMWLSILQQDWWSIAVVPTDRLVSVEPVMLALSRIGQLHQVRIIDGQGISVADGLKLGAMMLQAVGIGPRSVVSVDSVVESLGGVSVVDRVSKVLLVMSLGLSRLESVESTIRIVGRDRVLGAVLVEAR